ncbi:hypothetical protein ACE1EB_004399 [Salmonella enterica]
MNANTKTPSLLEVSASAVNQKVKETVSGISSGEKMLVSLLAVVADRWFGTDKGGVDVVQNYVNALADYPVKQKNAAKLFKQFLPVLIEIDESGKVTVTNEIKLSALTDEQKQTLKAAIEAFKGLNFPSLAAAVKSDGKKDNSFKPVELNKLKVKIGKTAATLVATALLSDANQTLEDVKAALAAAISGLTAAEIETAKSEILKKKPLKEVPKAA